MFCVFFSSVDSCSFNRSAHMTIYCYLFNLFNEKAGFDLPREFLVDVFDVMINRVAPL